MPMDQKQRDKKAKAKQIKYAEKELRHRVRPGIEQAMQRITQRGGGITINEILQISIMKMDLMDDQALREHLIYPRHEIMVSEDVARAIYDAGVRNIRSNPDQDPSDEIVIPQ